MSKEARKVVQYYRIYRLKITADNMIKQTIIAILAFFVIWLLFGVTSFRSVCLTGCIYLIFPVLLGFIFSCILKIYERSNENILGSEKQLTISSIKDIVEILKNDKRLHSEIVSQISNDEGLMQIENTRYKGVRRFHYTIWFMQSEIENDEFRRRPTTKEETEEYLEYWRTMKEELLFVFMDDEEMQDHVIEQYNRIKTKTLVWPKVISK